MTIEYYSTIVAIQEIFLYLYKVFEIFCSEDVLLASIGKSCFLVNRCGGNGNCVFLASFRPILFAVVALRIMSIKDTRFSPYHCAGNRTKTCHQ